MKVFILDDKNSYVYDGSRNRQFIELAPCSDCKTFLWSDDERTLIQDAVQFVWELSDFELDVWHALSATYCSKDANDAIRLGNLLNPLRDLFEYDSEEIGSLRDVLQLAAFAGPISINIEKAKIVYKKIRKFVVHIHNKHRDEKGKVLAPSDWFNNGSLDWIDLDRLLSFLPGVRGKSESEIAAYLKEEWEKLDRCKKCNQILAIGQDEGKLNGICYKCEPQQIFENSTDGKQVPSQ